MNFNTVYYEPDSLTYPLGQKLKADFSHLPWIPIKSHNRIEEMQKKSNAEFYKMKSYLIIGTRKTHRYVENAKISDYLVPFTSSGCTAACLYCYLVCNYNKCSYLRLFVNREQMMDKLLKTSYQYSHPCTFEIGSNSDLILENTITQNLQWIIPYFAKEGRGNITFPTKFTMVEPLLPLDHQGKTIFRMSVNPSSIIDQIEIGTASLSKRIQAINSMCEAGYPTGILIAPVILTEDYKQLYEELLITLEETLTEKTKKQLFIEVIFMTYSFIHRAINQEAFPNRPDLYHKELMTGRGRGRYCYRPEARAEGEIFIKDYIKKYLPEAHLVYIS
ncbi:MAG TPA: spore photoproduct lyase [Candidatus Merdenecus merdavium]|nr:spore photoproduct lyase [Candidatus Merdenecus merdavium]